MPDPQVLKEAQGVVSMPLWMLLAVIVALALTVVGLFRLFDHHRSKELERAYKREDQYIADRVKAMDTSIAMAKMLDRLTERFETHETAQREFHSRIERAVAEIRQAQLTGGS